MLLWQGVGRGARVNPGGMSCPLAGWGSLAERIHGEGAVPYREELQAWDLSCRGGCGAACVRLRLVPQALLPVPGLASCRTSTRRAVGSMAWPLALLLPPPPALAAGPSKTNHSSARLRPRAQLKIKTNQSSASAEIQCPLPSCPHRGWHAWGRVLGCWQRCSGACCCQWEMQSGLTGPDPFPSSPSIPSGSQALPWCHGLLASLPAWPKLAWGQGRCRREVELPTAGSGLRSARTSCHTSRAEESTRLPSEIPKFLLQDLHRVISHLRGSTSLFPLKASSQGWEAAMPPFPGKGCSKVGKEAALTQPPCAAAGTHPAPCCSPTLHPTRLCPRAGQGKAAH